MLFNKRTKTMIIRAICILVIVIFTLLIVSLFGAFLMTIDRRWDFEGTADGWLGYWGGIIGSAIGVIGALFVLQSQIKSDQAARKEEKIDNTFFNLLNLFNAIQAEILKAENKNNIFDNMHRSLLIEREKFDLREKQRYIEDYWEKNSAGIRKIINDLYTELLSIAAEEISANKIYPIKSDRLNEYVKMKERNRSNINTSEEVSLFRDIEIANEEMILALRILYTLSDNIINMPNFNQSSNDSISVQFLDSTARDLNSIRSNQWFQAKLISSNNRIALDNFTNELALELLRVVTYNTEQKNLIIEKGLRKYYGQTGKYFRMVHRIVKYINNNVRDIDQRTNYIGFLRAMVNEKEIVILYYNSFFTNRGDGLGKEIQKTKFFGDEKDLEKGKISHFSDDLLLWVDEDLEKMRAFKYE